MSLGTLLNNADCGPSNPLQQLSKRLDTDRGVQQDYFGASRAGPSRAVPSSSLQVFSNQSNHPYIQAFHQSRVADLSLQSEATQFFEQGAAPRAFDLSGLSAALPLQKTPNFANQPSRKAPWKLQAQAVQHHDAPVKGWAIEFLAAEEQGAKSPTGIQFVQGSMVNANIPQHSFAPMPHMAPMHMGQQFNGIHVIPPTSQMMSPLLRPQASSKVSWDEEFLALTRSLQQEPRAEHASPMETAFDGDELARAAGMLVDAVKEETNPKFKNSAFLSFMRQVRDKEVVVDGNDMVRASEATTTTSGEAQSRPINAPMGIGLQQRSVVDTRQYVPTFGQHRKSVHFESTQDAVASIDGDEEDAYWETENREYAAYWDEADASKGASSTRLIVPPLQEQGLQGKEWDTLQGSWDQWEATATGVKRVYEYQFQESNPYLVGQSSTTIHHTTHNIVEQGILEHEADVLRDPENAQAWFDLGVKQQANEREDKAIQALRRAIELDPSLLAAWLELAVSYTNEGHRSHAYDAIEDWVNRKEIYADAVRRWKESYADSHTRVDRAQDLISCLIEMVRSVPGGAIDADLQIALGVLLTTSEEYEKAKDCFEAALEVRPDDYLLYNRIGATLANGGHPEEAIYYYQRALELNPTYIRARFNLGISYITLQRYEGAAVHILDALALQENDGLGDNRGVTSSVLWNSLRNVCNHLGRNDLALFCDARNLNMFRAEFLQKDTI